MNVNERSISHMLALYLKAEFPDWDVDCEYNKDGHFPKKIFVKYGINSDDADAKTIYPDIIIHHRGTDMNLLAIEIKKSTNNEPDKYDIDKLKEMKNQIGYLNTLFIRFEVGPKKVGILKQIWISNRDK